MNFRVRERHGQYPEVLSFVLAGEALTPFRVQVVIATKYGFREGDVSAGLDSRPQRIREVAEAALSPLGNRFLTGAIDENTTFDGTTSATPCALRLAGDLAV
jgi:aryl-alcohol dehydrogenase-like predicted oxidoreductase